MDLSVDLENPEYPHPFDNQDLNLYPHRVNEESLHQTSEYSTQVNMDRQFPREQLSKIKKKNRKKEYKRRRKEKLREEQRYAKIHLAEVIDLIYKQQANFEQCKQQIEGCLQLLLGGDKFYTFLNQTIRIQVNNIQKDIWDYMQEIIKENPFEKPSEDQDFYLRMVDKIYLEYQKLQRSSNQIQKIINFYMYIGEMLPSSDGTQNLDRNTFNYLIESDETIKSLVRICEKRISIRHETQIKKLQIIESMMSGEDSEYDEYEQYITQKSTSVDEEEQEEKAVKKVRRKKLKESELLNDSEDVCRRLNEMIIVDDSRSNCKAEDDWLDKIACKYGVKN